ncbi:MAG: ParB/RepB/Spo0J family partition protein, partial [Alphaproteobacteria bacterium]
MNPEGSDSARRRGLAKGLSALLGEAAPDTGGAPGEAGPQSVPIEFLRPNRFQPRRRFDEADIRGLADSVREKGILQPLVVRSDPEITGSYEIVVGERRWRAAQLAQLHEIPVVVRELSDGEALEVALVENIQREDLSPLEEADAYQRLIDEFGHSQEALAKVVGKSRSHVANTLRLLGLPEAVKAMLHDGRLSAGHARALLAAPDPAALAEEVTSGGLNVRQTEGLVRGKASGNRRPRPAPAADAETRALERSLSDRIGLTVRIIHRGVRGGRVEIHYRKLDQLDDIVHRLGG